MPHRSSLPRDRHKPIAGTFEFTTVDELEKWDAALYTDRLVKKETLEKVWPPFVRNDGKATKHGYGWIVLGRE